MVLPLWFLISALHLHGLEGLGEVVTLREVLRPFPDVGLEKCALFSMLHHTLQGGVGGCLARGEVGEEGEREREGENR